LKRTEHWKSASMLCSARADNTDMMDEIFIEGLKIYGYHGVYPQEEARGQNFVLSVRLFLSLQQAGLTDDLTKSISYEEVCLFLKEEFNKERHQLIETVAERLAAALFKKYESLCALELRVAKPEAPIAVDFKNVSVCISRKRHIVYLSYGANEGDCPTQIEGGFKRIDEDPCCGVIKKTRPLITTPYGGVAQQDFYNGAAKIWTLYEPHELLKFLHDVEASQGLDRSKKTHWGPRALDLDILFYDDIVLDDEELTIPHPDMENRDFVMKPLAELAPFYRHPLTKKTVAMMAAAPMEEHIVS